MYISPVQFFGMLLSCSVKTVGGSHRGRDRRVGLRRRRDSKIDNQSISLTLPYLTQEDATVFNLTLS